MTQDNFYTAKYKSCYIHYKSVGRKLSLIHN